MAFLKRFVLASLFLLLGVSVLSAKNSSYSTRNLSEQELQVVYHDLDEPVLEEHSFIFTDKELDGIALIASTSTDNRVLQFRWKSPTFEDGYLPLPEAVSKSWAFAELKAVSFGDFNGDGRGPDVIVIAEYILPGRAMPSPVATAYFHGDFYTYTTDKKLNDYLYLRATRTVSEARTNINSFFKR